MAVGGGGGVGVTYLALHKRVCMCRGGGDMHGSRTSSQKKLSA